MHAVTLAEDFAFFQQKVPGLFFFVGAMPLMRPKESGHLINTPDFFIDEKAFITGVKAMLNLNCRLYVHVTEIVL